MRPMLVALMLGLSACSAPVHVASVVPPPVHRASGMGMDAFGHTRMSAERATVDGRQRAHVERLMHRLRINLQPYRNVDAAIAAGYLPQGDDVPVGALKHFVNEANLHANWHHLDPDKPMALLYRRTTDGFELAGVMFSAPISVSMDNLDRRVPLALGHWHSHRNVCQPHAGQRLTRAQERQFGFSGSINTRSACKSAGGVFLDNVYGWMVHVYPFEREVAKQF